MSGLNKKYNTKSLRHSVLLTGLTFAVCAYVYPLHAENKLNDPCKKALNCYSTMVSGYDGKNTVQLRKEKRICDQFKEECDRLKKTKNKPSSNLQQAYAAFQQAYKRYTAMVTNSYGEDPETIKKALEAYRNTYAHYKKLKNAQQASTGQSQKNKVLDISGVDGIESIDPANVEDNIEYFEGLRKRSNSEAHTKTKSPVNSKKNKKQAQVIRKNHFRVIKLTAKTKTLVPEPYDMISKVISKKGGVISDDAMSLRIPANALHQKQKIVVKKIHGVLPEGRHENGGSLPEVLQVGIPYDFGPDSIHFEKPVTLSIKYKGEDIPDGIPESNLFLVYYDGEKWIKIDAFQDKKTNTFYANVEGFPGSIIVTVGVPVLIAAGAYALKTGVHKKIYQLIWDPIKKNWVHKFIKPRNKLVKKYAKRISVTSEIGKSNIVSFDNPKKLAAYLHRKITSKNPELIIGFKGNNNKFTDLTDKYISEADTVEPVEHYLNNIERKEKKFGDCIDVANTLVSILRSKGYSIKGVSGYLNGKPHAWSEIVIGNEVYGIDELGRISKLDYLKKSVTYPKPGDPYRKEWDEKGTRVYKPTMLIAAPGSFIYAGDGKKHVFTLKTFGLPKYTLFSWNFNNLGNSIKRKKKSFSYKFEATGSFPLKATAYWDGKKLTKSVIVKVKGKPQIGEELAKCQNKRFHFNSANEKFDFILLTPTELYKESERFIGKKLTSKRKKKILELARQDFNAKNSYYKKILSLGCFKKLYKKELLVAWDGKYLEKGIKQRTYKRGYPTGKFINLKESKKQTPAGGGNPFGGYTPDYGMSKVIK